MMKWSCWNVLLSLSLIAGMAAIPLPVLADETAPPKPSFSCTHAQGAVEKAVCASPALAAADHEMAALYAVNRVSAFGHGPSNQLAAQRQMLKDMRRACRLPADCAKGLQGIYDDRSYDLAIAALLRARALALPVIRRIDPTYAPIAEAIGIWAAEPQNTDWSAPQRADKRARILTLLRPVMTNLVTNKDFGDNLQGMLADTQLYDKGAVTRIEDVLISERHFVVFLNIIGAYLDGPNPRTITCEAIVRHPSLLDATGAVFGGTIDRFVLGTDCDQTLPPTPALATLDDKLSTAWWPACQGTIRFSISRDYQMALDSVRLGLAKYDAKTAPRPLRGIKAADIAATRAELALYYAQYLGKPQKTAKVMARDAVNALLNVAHECDPD